MIHRISPLLVLAVFTLDLPAQVSKGGQPIGPSTIVLAGTDVPTVSLGPLEGSEAEEAVSNAQFRYGVQRTLAVEVTAAGRWDVLSDGSRLCRLKIQSADAIMLSVQFDAWEMGEGSTVFLYDEEGSTVIGGFDNSNRGPDGSMATQVLPGDAVTIEYRVPAGVPRGSLHVSSITHCIIDVFRELRSAEDRDYNPGYQSAACQINVNCPVASAWQDQKRSVVMFLRPDGSGCTANLINNTAVPGRPYVHLAFHCLVESTMNQWVFYFNYESPGCVGTSGPTTQTLTGVSMVANYILDDFVLAQLNTPPPASYNVYYAGWDRSGNVPQTVTVLEHPLYDVKKIAFDNNPATSSMDDYVHTWRAYWDNGITEWGASGAPCFDQNKRFIGHVVSGNMACSESQTVPAEIAKFSESWTGDYPTGRLRDWLDPSNSVMVLDGYDPNASAPVVRVRLKAFLEGPYVSGTSLMSGALRSAGLVPLTEPYTAQGYVHVGGGGGESTTSGVLAISGNSSVVDWVVVELRSATNSTQVLATKSALLLRNGSVVGVDGVSDVSFSRAAGNYFIALRHRNHLGIMSAQAIALDDTADPLDLSNGSLALFNTSNATKNIAGVRVMYAGDVSSDGIVRYAGAGNDRDIILVRVGGVIPTSTWTGYSNADVNLDGTVSYSGGNNDRDIILVNIGGSTVTGTRVAALP